MGLVARFKIDIAVGPPVVAVLAPGDDGGPDEHRGCFGHEILIQQDVVHASIIADRALPTPGGFWLGLRKVSLTFVVGQSFVITGLWLR